MSTPFSFSGTLSFPPDANVPPELVGIAFSANYDEFLWTKMDLTGSGTKTVPFGDLGAPGAKCVVVKVDASATASAINLRWNGGGASGQQEISPGGFLVLGSGTPGTGLTALDIVYTSNVTVRVLLLG